MGRIRGGCNLASLEVCNTYHQNTTIIRGFFLFLDLYQILIKYYENSLIFLNRLSDFYQ